MLKKLTRIIAIILCTMLIVSFVAPSFSNFAFAEETTKEDYSGSAIAIIKEQVAMWYYIIRTVCVAIMLILLIFIGINLAIKSTTSADRAFYKKMLADWVAGMVLVFGIHYIMIGILTLNELSVDMIAETGKAIYRAEPSEYGDIRDLKVDPTTGELTDRTNEDVETSIFENLRTRAYELRLSVGVPGMFLYGAFVYYAWKYTFIYLRRVFNIWVLTLMGPPISVSYALNKTLTGKSKIFSAWLREYIMNTFIQSIHALCYVTFTLPVLKFSLKSIAGLLLSIAMLKFMSDADKIIRKIFSVGGSEGSAIGAISDRNIGREAIKSYMNAYKSVAGIGAVRAVANLERKAILAAPTLVAKKGFGVAMQHAKNTQEKRQAKSDRRFENKLEKQKAEFIKEKFGQDITDVKRTKDKDGVKRYNYDTVQEHMAEIKAFENSKRAERKNKTDLILNSGIVKGFGELDGKTFGVAINTVQNRLDEEKSDYENIVKDEEVPQEKKDEQFAKIQADELLLKNLLYKRDTKLRAQLRLARVGLGEVFDPNLYTEKQKKYNPETGKYEETGKYVAKKSVGRKREGFFKYSKEADGLGTQIKKNILSASGLFNLNEEEKKAFADAKADIIDSTKALIGTIGGIVTLGEGAGISAGLFTMAASSQANKIQRQNDRLEKMQTKFQAFDGPEFEIPEGEESSFSARELVVVAKNANTLLAQERDKYIVRDITKKKSKFVKFLMSGHIHAVNGLSGLGGGRGMAAYYRGGSDGTHSVGIGYSLRETEINKFYEQELANKRKAITAAAKVVYNEAKENAEKVIEMHDKQVNQLKGEDLLKEGAKANGFAYDTGDEFINLSGETITEDTLFAPKKPAKEQDGFLIILPIDNVPSYETNERVEKEEEEHTEAKPKTQVTIKITKKDAEDAIKQAAIKGGFETIAAFGKSSKANRDQAIKILIDNLKKEGVVSGEIESQLEAVTAIGDIIDDNLTDMVAREEVNAATVEVMDEVVSERKEALKEDPNADVSSYTFESKETQTRIRDRAEERLRDYVKEESEAFSGDTRVTQADSGSLKTLNQLSGTRRATSGDSQLGGRVEADGDIASRVTAEADAGSRVTAEADVGSQVIADPDVASRVGSGEGKVKRVKGKASQGKSTPTGTDSGPMVGQLFAPDDSKGVAGSIETQAKERRASVLQSRANSVLQTNRSVNASSSTKVESKRKFTKEEAEEVVDDIKEAKRVEIAEALAKVAQENTYATVERTHQRLSGQPVSEEPSVEELFKRSGLDVDKKLAASPGSGENNDPEYAAKKRDLMENLAAGFAAYQMLQAEKSTLRDYTEFKADSDPVLVEISPKKSEKRKHMYMGMVDDSGSLFGEIDYKKFATMPGVGKELNNLIIAVNNASGSAYSQADYDAYSQSTPQSSQQSTQDGRQEVPNKGSRRVQYDSSSSQNAVDQMRKNAPKS